MPVTVIPTGPPIHVDVINTPIRVDIQLYRPAPAAGGGGSNPTLLTRVAAETLSGARLVRIDTTNQARIFDATLPDGHRLAVITTGAVNLGATATIHTTGPFQQSAWGLTPEARYFAGPNGTLTTTVPTVGTLICVGVALDAETLLYQPRTFLRRI